MKKFFKVAVMTGLLTFLKMLMGFAIAKLVAIYAGPSGMTMLGQIQSTVAGLNGIVSAPVGNGVVRFTAEKCGADYRSCSPWWRASVQWMFLIWAILIPLGLINSELISMWIFHTYNYVWIIKLTILMLPLASLGTLITSVINGIQNFRRFVVLGILSVLLSSSFMILMIIYKGIDGALLAVGIQYGLIGAILLCANIKQPWFKLKYWYGNTTNEARKQIGGYILMALTTAVMTPLSLIIIRNILVANAGWEMTGQWQAVWKISEVYLSIITIALSTYYLPKLSSTLGVDNIIKEINKTALFVIPLCAFLALLVYLFRDLAIYILFTADFEKARDLFAIQLCGDVIKIASWVYAYPMLSRGATKWFVTSEVFFSLSFIILGYFLVTNYGVHGANYAYLINYTLYFVFIVINVKKFSK